MIAYLLRTENRAKLLTVAVALSLPAAAMMVRRSHAMSHRPAIADRAPLTIIAIDPGHGGRDPGAIGCHGAVEKNVTLPIGLDLARLIDEAPGVRAVLTRQRDDYVGLRQRRIIAERAGAKVFVSIHANAGKPSWRGGTVFAQPVQNPEGKASARLAGLITRQLATIEPVDRQRRADFVVLRSTRIPCVLVETAYITNPIDERHLTNPVFQRKIAAAVFRGIMQFLMSRRAKK